MQTSQAKDNQAPLHINSTPQSKLLEIEREFHVPVAQLFQAFASADALKKWWWPRGLYSDRIDLEFKEGGKYFINMKGMPDAGGGGMCGEFEEIIENERIVMTDNFADDSGRPISAAEAKMSGEWPKVGYITFEFEAAGDKASRFKLFQEGIPESALKDCIQGWSESFDKLREFLEK